MSSLAHMVRSAGEYAQTFLEHGQVARYIPELSHANPNHLGIVVIGPDGKLEAWGDTQQKFTIQSIVKCCFLLFTLEYFGPERVFSLVHMEPSGESFSSPSTTAPPLKRPANPFINAGALVLSSLIISQYTWADFISYVQRLVGRELSEIDEAVYRSEMEHSDHHTAVFKKLRELDILAASESDTLDFYVRACSILVDSVDLAHMARSIFDPKKVDIKQRRTLQSILLTCGMYNGSGEYAVKVGIPSKSGVGGGLLGLHRDYAFGLFGPSLDAQGNSVGAVRAMRYLSQALTLHCFE